MKKNMLKLMDDITVKQFGNVLLKRYDIPDIKELRYVVSDIYKLYKKTIRQHGKYFIKLEEKINDRLVVKTAIYNTSEDFGSEIPPEVSIVLYDEETRNDIKASGSGVYGGMLEEDIYVFTLLLKDIISHTDKYLVEDVIEEDPAEILEEECV